MSELREPIEKILEEASQDAHCEYPIKDEVTDQILTLLDKEIQKARIDEVKNTDEKFSSLHQTTEGAGYVSYGEFGEYLDNRIKQLKKGKE